MGNFVDSCFWERDRCSYICSRSQSAARSKSSVDLIVSDTALLPIGGVIRLRFAGLPCAISMNGPFLLFVGGLHGNLKSTRNFVSKTPRFLVWGAPNILQQKSPRLGKA